MDFLLAHNEHMRLAIPDNTHIISELVRSPQSIAQPVGWKSLLELGPHEATISTKCLGRCPHCQVTGIRLPLGIEGAIVGKSVLLTESELRGFSIEKPWSAQSAQEKGAEAYKAWEYEDTTPPLDTPVKMSQKQIELLNKYIDSVPLEDTT